MQMTNNKYLCSLRYYQTEILVHLYMLFDIQLTEICS
jgi:hypothetical protein